MAKKVRTKSLRRFVPMILDFYETILDRGITSKRRISDFYKGWEKKESPDFAAQGRVLIQALLDAIAQSKKTPPMKSHQKNASVSPSAIARVRTARTGNGR
jgi:hypothetical protein